MTAGGRCFGGDVMY